MFQVTYPVMARQSVATLVADKPGYRVSALHPALCTLSVYVQVHRINKTKVLSHNTHLISSESLNHCPPVHHWSLLTLVWM